MNLTPPVPVYSFLRNHFDLVWRRCWQRPYEHEGRIYQPYAHVQRLITDRMLDMAESKGAVVELEQGLSLRDYLANRPGARNRLRRLASDGRFQMLACGEAILDSNQCCMETLVRNLASGQILAADVTGQMPSVAGRFDSFGSSAQLPQIHRQCGIKWVTGFSYAVPQGKYWRGLDGSVVCVIADQFPGAHQFLDHCYHEPCPRCGGKGCRACEATGIDLPANVYPPRQLESAPPEAPFLVYWVQSEEMLPDPSFPDELRKQLPPGYSAEWGGLHAIARHLADEIEAAGPGVDVDPRLEFNPVQTGTYVTRMRVKSAARKAERFFYTAEAACMLATLGKSVAVNRVLRNAWLEIPLLFFHDSITGTHIDPAQQELLDTAASVRRAAGKALVAASLSNGASVRPFGLADAQWQDAVIGDPAVTTATSGACVSPVYSVVDEDLADSPRLRALRTGSRCRDRKLIERRVLVQRGKVWRLGTKRAAARALPEKGEVQTPHFKVSYDTHGLLSIRDKSTGALLSGGKFGRPNSLLLEFDEGDPWGTRGSDRRRTALDSETNSFFLGARRTGPLVEIVHGGTFEPNNRFGREADPSVFGLEWTKTVRLHDESGIISFSTEIYWKSANRRIRVVFPGRPGKDNATYGIPGGYLERQRYEQTDRFLWSPDGNWPALDFFARTDANPAPALLNKGAVGARVEDGAMMISLLRSPAFGHCLERYAQDYALPYAGVRDSGYHLVEYGLTACRGASDVPRVAREARAWNERALLCPSNVALPAIKTGHPALEAIALKPRFKCAGAVLRVLNNSNAAVCGAVGIDRCRLVPCSPLEVPVDDPGDRFGPFEFRTYLVEVE